MAGKVGWSAYRPSKAIWFWSCAGCIVATLLVGFVWLGWVSGGTADEMARDASEQGRANLAAELCVFRFMDAPDAADRLAELNEQSTRQRDDYIESGGWVTFVELDGVVGGAAQLCADQLADLEITATDDPAAPDSTDDETAVN